MVCCVKECDLLLSNPAPTLNLYIYLFIYFKLEIQSLLTPRCYYITLRDLWGWNYDIQALFDAEMKCLFAVFRCPAAAQHFQCCLCRCFTVNNVVSISLTAPHATHHHT